MKRIVRITLWVGVGLVGLAVGALATLKYVLLKEGCAHETQLLAEDSRGRSVVYEFEACTTIGTEVDARVDLIASSGRRRSLLRFVPADGYLSYRGVPVKEPLLPSATWTSPHTLTISIGTVAEVLEQQAQIDDVAVTYEIDTNLHVERGRNEGQ